MNYDQMSIDDLFAWRDQWPEQRTEWNRAELALQKRRAVRDAYLDLAEAQEDARDRAVKRIRGYLATDPMFNMFATPELAIDCYVSVLAAPIQGEAR